MESYISSREIPKHKSQSSSRINQNDIMQIITIKDQSRFSFMIQKPCEIIVKVNLLWNQRESDTKGGCKLWPSHNKAKAVNKSKRLCITNRVADLIAELY